MKQQLFYYSKYRQHTFGNFFSCVIIYCTHYILCIIMCCTCYSIGLQSHIHVYCTLWVIEGSSRVIFAVSVNLSHTPMRKDSPAWECSVESPFCSSLLQIHPFCPGVGDSQNLLSESLVLRLLSWIWKYFKTIPTLQSYCFWQTRQAARTPLALDCAGLLVPWLGQWPPPWRSPLSTTNHSSLRPGFPFLL